MQDTCILSLRRMCIRRETPTTLCTIVASSLFAWELATRLTYASSLWRSHFELGLSTEQKHNPLIPLSLQHECINSYGYNNYSLISSLNSLRVESHSSDSAYGDIHSRSHSGHARAPMRYTAHYHTLLSRNTTMTMAPLAMFGSMKALAWCQTHYYGMAGLMFNNIDTTWICNN